jgi:hypothetical protein
MYCTRSSELHSWRRTERPSHSTSIQSAAPNAQLRRTQYRVQTNLTLSLLMSYIYGAPSKARNLTSYIYRREFLLGILLLEPCISLIYAWKTNKYTNYSLSLLSMYGSSYMLCVTCYVSWLHQEWSSTPTLVQPTDITRNIPSAVFRAPPEDDQVMLETCRGP